MRARLWWVWQTVLSWRRLTLLPAFDTRLAKKNDQTAADADERKWKP